VQISGEPRGFAREDITLQAGGSAQIMEYDAPQRSDVGSWSASGSTIAIDFQSFCDRSGTVDATRMRLTCVLGSQRWEITYEKQ
jgi:hypothetical protein